VVRSDYVGGRVRASAVHTWSAAGRLGRKTR
jgi:hypothetical protein